MIDCYICNRTFGSYKALASHIRQTHQISSEDYYFTYINSNNKCKTCGQPTSFISLSEGFRKHCSSKCQSNDPEVVEKQLATFFANPNNTIKARERIIKYNKSEKGRATSSRIGKITGGISFKRAHNNDGLKWCEQCKQQTMHVLGIGCMTCFNQNDQHKINICKAIQQKYGSQYKNVFQVAAIKEKSIKTSLERYGISNPGNSRQARQKANHTMRKNGNYSTYEDGFETKLKEKHIKYKTQYSSEKYPFPCDFYLPETDTYIELNIFWSHGKHFFDKNSVEDTQILQQWQNKAKLGHKQYANAIQVWTKKDPLKKETAMKNKLNYVVLWNKTDIERYLLSI